MDKEEIYKYAKYLLISHLEDGIEFLSVFEQYPEYKQDNGAEIAEGAAQAVHNAVGMMMRSLAEAVEGTDAE